MKRFLLIPAILMATTGPALADEEKAETRTITLDEAVSLATGSNWQIEMGEDKITAAKEAKAATKTLRLPSLGVRANLFIWDSKIETAFAPPPAPPITIRNQITGDVTVTVFESLTGLSVLGRLIEGNQAAVDQAHAELDATKRGVALQVAVQYLALLKAQTLLELNNTAVTQLEADLKQIRALRDAKVLSDLDVLRLETALESAKAGVLTTEALLTGASREFANMLDLPENTALRVAPIDTTPPELPWTEDEAVALAKQTSPEMRQIDAVIEQSEVGVDVVKAEYLPTVNALVSYTHSEQGSPFQIKDSGFVGLQLQWNIWDWGKRGHELKQAKAARKIAKRSKEMAERNLTVNIRNSHMLVTNQKKTLEVYEAALKTAEEAYRLQTVRIQGGTATTAEVIDAESEVSRARAQATIARYDYLNAWLGLAALVGQTPSIPGAK